MDFYCIVCKSDKSISHTMKDAKSGDLISITCCQNHGLVQLKDLPTALDLFEFHKYKL